MPTIGPISIAANGDDGSIWYTSLWQFNSAGENSGGEAYFGDNGGFYYYLFLRFILSAAIPSGATIDSATLELYGLGIWQWVDGTDDLTVLATDSADAAAPASAAARPSESGGSTALTAASASWLNVTWNTAGWNTSSDIKAVIQELVNDNGGLASGAGIVLWVRKSTISDGHQVSTALLEHATADPAKLTINYTAAGGGSAGGIMLLMDHFDGGTMLQ